MNPCSVLLYDQVAEATGEGSGIGRGIARGPADAVKTAIWERDADIAASAGEEVGAGSAITLAGATDVGGHTSVDGDHLASDVGGIV